MFGLVLNLAASVSYPGSFEKIAVLIQLLTWSLGISFVFKAPM